MSLSKKIVLIVLNILVLAGIFWQSTILTAVSGALINYSGLSLDNFFEKLADGQFSGEIVFGVVGFLAFIFIEISFFYFVNHLAVRSSKRSLKRAGVDSVATFPLKSVKWIHRLLSLGFSVMIIALVATSIMYIFQASALVHQMATDATEQAKNVVDVLNKADFESFAEIVKFYSDTIC